MYWGEQSRVGRTFLLMLVFIAGVLTGCGMSSNSTSGGGGSGGGGAHSVNLSWKPSTSSSIVGYNVYRGSTTASLGLLNSMNTGTSYTDSTVQNGTTYYYAVTAVDSAGVESPHSNTAQAVIP